jgi:hypothetical protein
LKRKPKAPPVPPPVVIPPYIKDILNFGAALGGNAQEIEKEQKHEN